MLEQSLYTTHRASFKAAHTSIINNGPGAHLRTRILQRVFSVTEVVIPFLPITELAKGQIASHATCGLKGVLDLGDHNPRTAAHAVFLTAKDRNIAPTLLRHITARHCSLPQGMRQPVAWK